MPTRQEIRDVESQVNALTRRIHETFATREKSKAQWERWEARATITTPIRTPQSIGAAIDLTMSEIERVNGILVTVVDSRKRREFREFCRLAVKVASPTLVAQLSRRETAADAGVRSRAARMLSYIRKHRDLV